MSYKRKSPVPVIEGGTGDVTMTTAYAPVCAGTTATAALQVASTGLSNSGYVFSSTGASSLPSFQGIVNLPTTTSSVGQYQINGSPVLHSYGTENIFVGPSATAAPGNFTLTGTQNTGIGWQSLKSLTSGTNNLGIGAAALFQLTTGQHNCAVGPNAGDNYTSSETSNIMINNEGTLGESNTLRVGSGAGTGDKQLNRAFIHGIRGITSGNSDQQVVQIDASGQLATNTGVYMSAAGAVSNIFAGYQAGNGSVSGTQNTGIGWQALKAVTSGTNNLGIGAAALFQLTTGQHNCAVGPNAGDNYTSSETSNIMINNEGTLGESNTLRVGSGAGTGDKQLNRAFIHGIRGITTANNDAIAVLIDSAGQLGTVSSSIRYKENVIDMGDVSSPVMNLRPVTFDFIGRPSHKKQVGLIAEEVEQIMPSLVAYNQEGTPESVKYHELPILLLNEIQKLLKRVDDLEVKLSSK